MVKIAETGVKIAETGGAAVVDGRAVTAPRGAVCALCGTGCRAPFVAPPAELAPDLDLRPGEPTRSSLGRWVMTCRGCGATAPDLARLAVACRAVVEGEAYRALGGRQPERGFLRWAALCEAAGERVEAAEAVLQAAWAMDDAGGDARALRARAAALWGEPATMQDGVRLVDVRRRAGDFAGAEGLAAALLAREGLDETVAAVLRYQLGLIAGLDAGRHLMSSALRPPAQRPHVTHGRAAKPVSGGFWRRLLSLDF